MSLFRIFVLIAALPWLLSCSEGLNYQEVDSPIALQKVPAMLPKPKVALVLGSGGPRGYAHIDILKVLEQHNIEVDLVVGSSVGALIGALAIAPSRYPECQLKVDLLPYLIFTFFEKRLDKRGSGCKIT